MEKIPRKLTGTPKVVDVFEKFFVFFDRSSMSRMESPVNWFFLRTTAHETCRDILELVDVVDCPHLDHIFIIFTFL